MLTARQRRAYQDLCTVIKVDRDSDSDGKGKPGPETYTVLKRNVRYHHQTTQNISDPTVIGRVLRANLLTKELGHFDVADNIPNNAILINTSKDAFGNPTRLNGKKYRVLGPDQDIPSRGVRKANKQVILLREMEKTPTGLPT